MDPKDEEIAALKEEIAAHKTLIAKMSTGAAGGAAPTHGLTPKTKKVAKPKMIEGGAAGGAPKEKVKKTVEKHYVPNWALIEPDTPIRLECKGLKWTGVFLTAHCFRRLLPEPVCDFSSLNAFVKGQRDVLVAQGLFKSNSANAWVEVEYFQKDEWLLFDSIRAEAAKTPKAAAVAAAPKPPPVIDSVVDDEFKAFKMPDGVTVYKNNEGFCYGITPSGTIGAYAGWYDGRKKALDPSVPEPNDDDESNHDGEVWCTNCEGYVTEDKYLGNCSGDGCGLDVCTACVKNHDPLICWRCFTKGAETDAPMPSSLESAIEDVEPEQTFIDFIFHESTFMQKVGTLEVYLPDCKTFVGTLVDADTMEWKWRLFLYKSAKGYFKNARDNVVQIKDGVATFKGNYNKESKTVVMCPEPTDLNLSELIASVKGKE